MRKAIQPPGSVPRILSGSRHRLVLDQPEAVVIRALIELPAAFVAGHRALDRFHPPDGGETVRAGVGVGYGV